MNEPEFEDQLRALRPAAPHRSLEERIARELSPPSTATSGRLDRQREPRSWLERLLPALGWCVTGAAAAVVTMLLLNLFNRHITDLNKSPEVAITPKAEPAQVSTGGELLNAVAEGIYETDDEGPMRVVRYESLERRQWTDESGAITIVEVPREDVLRVPVTFQ